MFDVINFLSNNAVALQTASSLAQAASAFVIIFLTIVLAVYTAVLAKEAKLTRIEGQRPHVVVSLEPYKDYINFAQLIIENVGKGSAFQVEVSFSDKVSNKERELSNINLLKQEIIKPNASIKTFAGMWSEISPKKFEAKVKYQDSLGNVVNDIYRLDTDALNGLSGLGKDPLLEIAENSKKISQSIGHITSGSKKLKMEIYDRADRERDRAETEAWIAEQRARHNEEA